MSGPEIEEVEPDRKLLKIERHYLRVFRHLDPSLLTSAEPDWPAGQELEEDEPSDHVKFLDFYSRRGLEVVFERYGLNRQLRAAGYEHTTLHIERHAEGYDIFRVRSSITPHPLVELVARIAPLPPEAKCPPGAEGRPFLNVKWLRMQNPQAPPAPERPLLPGQAFPGLGIGREMMALLQMICVRLDLDGVYELPERLHNAVLYFRRFRFLDPEFQGAVTAILRDTRERPLSELSWGMECGALVDLNTGHALRWIPSEQVLPRTGPVLEWFASDDYLRRATAAMARASFRLASGDLAADLAGCGSGALTAGDNPIPARIK